MIRENVRVDSQSESGAAGGNLWVITVWRAEKTAEQRETLSGIVLLKICISYDQKQPFWSFFLWSWKNEIEECITSSLCCVFDSVNGELWWIKWKRNKKTSIAVLNNLLLHFHGQFLQCVTRPDAWENVKRRVVSSLHTPENKNAVLFTLWKKCLHIGMLTI